MKIVKNNAIITLPLFFFTILCGNVKAQHVDSTRRKLSGDTLEIFPAYVEKIRWKSHDGKFIYRMGADPAIINTQKEFSDICNACHPVPEVDIANKTLLCLSTTEPVNASSPTNETVKIIRDKIIVDVYLHYPYPITGPYTYSTFWLTIPKISGKYKLEYEMHTR